MPRPLWKQTTTSKDLNLNLPAGDSDDREVTLPNRLQTSSSQESSFPTDPLQRHKSPESKEVNSVCEEEKLKPIRYEGSAGSHRGSPPKLLQILNDVAKRLLEYGGPSEINVPRKDTDQAVDGMNGAAGAMNGASNLPVHAGQQMDLNFIYSKVLELSEQLRANREQTQGLIAGAEELASRAAATGREPEIHEANAQLSSARIADLTHKISELESVNKVLLREQRENGKLIGEYEQALEKVVAMLREYAYNKESEKSNLAKQYLSTLQAERDEHLKTRLERDTANTHILKLMSQMRQAYHLSVEESCPEVEIVSGLQNEVRSLRNALGLPKEKFEEETGYSVLKHVRGGPGEEDD